MSTKDQEAVDIVAKDSRLAPLAEAAKPSVNGPWWALKNSAGKKDVAMTLMVVCFLFTLGLAGMGAIETASILGQVIAFRAFDMGFATTVLVPLIGLYFGRRWTDTQRGLYDAQALHVGERSVHIQGNMEQPE